MEKLPFNPFIVKIYKRIFEDNGNALIIVNGSTGSGKSYATISLAKEISKEFGTNFNINDNLAFKFVPLLEKMNLPQNKKPGTVFVFEEVGSVAGGAASKKWQSKTNLFFDTWTQTSRYKNQILFMNCPNLSHLQKGSREMLHFQLETIGINKKQKVCNVKVFGIEVNTKSGKLYFKYLRVKYNGKTYKFKNLRVKHPGDVLATEYEKEKDKYVTELYDMMVEEEKAKEYKQPKKKIDELRLKELLEQGLTQKEIAKRLGVTRQAIWLSKKALFGQKSLRK